jgi:hypothetical protein
MIRHNVQLQYTKKEVRALLDTASRHHVDRGGSYATQSAAIHVWSPSGLPVPQPAAAVPLGTFYFDWTTLRLATIDCDEHFALDEALSELGKIEEMAFGKKKNGR